MKKKIHLMSFDVTEFQGGSSSQKCMFISYVHMGMHWTLRWDMEIFLLG